MAKSKYDLMRPSIVTDTNGNPYPDIATFDFNSFIPASKPIEYQLSNNDLYNFYSLINSYYSTFDFYDDIILWLNDIAYISDSINFQKTIKLYNKADIDNYYSNTI